MVSVYHTVFIIHSSTNGHMGCSTFRLLGITLLWTLVYEYPSKSLLSIPLDICLEVELMNQSNSIFNFLSSCHTGSHRSCTILRSHQESTKILISLYPYQYFFSGFCFCLVIAILMGEKWYLIVVLIFISLVISDVKHFFMCLLAFNAFKIISNTWVWPRILLLLLCDWNTSLLFSWGHPTLILLLGKGEKWTHYHTGKYFTSIVQVLTISWWWLTYWV